MKTLALCLVLVACSKDAPAIAAKDGPDGLRDLFARARAACEAKDYAKGRAIVESILPGTQQVLVALKSDTPPGFVDEIVGQTKEVPAEDEKAACLLSPPGRTQIIVHRATTEELAAPGDQTVAATEFPAGAATLTGILRPTMTFYEVETVEPGKDRGTKFHMFFWDGAQWRMLGPAWRYLSGESD
ncbi:MAG: hypothetical protein AB7T06_40140 [Kofleriaceae bacterium]